MMEFAFDVGTRVTLDNSAIGIVEGIYVDDGEPQYSVKYWDDRGRVQSSFFKANELQQCNETDSHRSDTR